MPAILTNLRKHDGAEPLKKRTQPRAIDSCCLGGNFTIRLTHGDQNHEIAIQLGLDPISYVDAEVLQTNVARPLILDR